ncbi:MAG: 6-pyruvoyl-tetrahydropterin synthase-related protein [Microgenomates group bacterium]
MIWLLLVLITIPGIRDLFINGFFWSHDSQLHLVRLMHFYSELINGQFPVRFGTNMAYGYGYPTFNYFYPLVYYLGSILKVIGLSFGDSYRVLNIICVFSSIWGMYAFLKGHFSKTASFLGSLLFMYTPYRFLAMYVNGSIGIVLALSIIPWVFWAIDNLGKKKTYIGVVILAIVSSLLPLAHNVSLLIFSLPILCYAILVLSKYRSKKLFWLFTLSGVLAIMISAFFWYPAISEMKMVGLGKNVVVNYLDHFPSWKQMLYSPWKYEYSNPGTDNDGMSMQVGFANIFVILISTILLVIVLIKRKIKYSNKRLLIYLVFFSYLGIFLMSPSSVFVWRIIPVLSQIQFPWRILMLTMLTSSVLAAMVFDALKGRKWKILLLVMIVGLLVINNRNYLRTWQKIRYDDQYFYEQHLFYGSTDIGWEAKPVWVRINPYFKPNIVHKATNFEIKEIIEGVSPRVKLQGKSAENSQIIFNLFYWPGWSVKNNDRNINLEKDEETGFLKTNLPQGENIVEVSIVQTKTENVGNVISLIGILGLFIVLIFGIRKSISFSSR